MRKKARTTRISAGVFFVTAILVYLVFHALNGNHGLYAYLKEQHKRETQQIKLAELTEQHKQLEKRVAFLSDGALDLDLLDERARLVLGYSNPEERVVILGEQTP